ncbi:M56 family metallopeptidase [Chryseobacterium sp. SSA4.19]|uniref:M56 family metallopeptidase n=1 Tax=Chryseobacterium sp. SSA4.19 TaxID=2919915 RepID=UPI001F4D8F3C|nr:M56 family metallopeptidase [Chryseobacterium sp. SSA4.19]MCJ8152982.1 M56 family metallopeptidase [Chryseobacterium sp. SSA4.19]
MIIIVKIILCSALLLTVYNLFLQKEKMYRFNRFYLLFSLLFSYAVPFVSVTAEMPKPIRKAQTIIESTQEILDLTQTQQSFDWTILAWFIYGSGTLLLLARAIVSIIKIKRLKGKKIIYQNQNMIITEKHLSPFSFWNTIYLGKNYWINDKIDRRIFLHEKAHLDQKHSIDLLVVEIVKIFTWFNPSVYFFQKAMVTNHEFLADEAVLENDCNVKDYQQLILHEIISKQNYNLTHTFNFKNTKNRFIMMNTKKTRLTCIKKMASIPVLTAAFLLFAHKNYATTLEHLVKDTQEHIFEPEKNPDAETVNKVITQPEQLSISAENAIQQEELSKNTNGEKGISDTLRPKEGNPTSLSQENTKSVNVSPTNDNISLPQFPGGNNELRNRVAKLFDGSKINTPKNKEMYRTDLSYTVKEDGTVTDIKASGNNELFNNETIAAFKKANANIVWKPAEKDGKAVSYTFRMPLTMSFE